MPTIRWNLRHCACRPSLRARRYSRGFSLIELLVALTLVGLLMVLMINGLQLSNRVWDTAERSRSGAEQVRRVQGLLRDLLEQAVMTRPVSIASPAEEGSGFLGTSDSLRFFGPLPARRAGASRHRLTLELVVRGSARQVVLSWMPLPWDEPLQQGLDRPGSRVLIEQVTSIEISYLASGRNEGEKRWTGHWEDTESLPLLIRIAITLDATQKGYWPPLLISPKINGKVS